jgi:hypothetical protein
MVDVIPQVSRMKAYIFNHKNYVHDNLLCIIYRCPQKRRRVHSSLILFNYLYTKLNGCEFTYSPKSFKAKLSKQFFFSNTIDEKGSKATTQVQGA